MLVWVEFVPSESRLVDCEFSLLAVLAWCVVQSDCMQRGGYPDVRWREPAAAVVLDVRCERRCVSVSAVPRYGEGGLVSAVRAEHAVW